MAVGVAPLPQPPAVAPRFPWLRWRYPADGSRDLRYDFLRGFAVVAMIVDHIGGPSPLYALTGGNRFYTSAAEGFIFISGLLVGIVYGRIALRDGVERAMLKALGRAGVLYLIVIGVTLPLIVVSELLDLPWATGVYLTDPLALIIGVFTLHRTYYLIDVMVLYTLLLLLSPLALYLLAKGRTAWLLLGSWGLWLAFQIAPESVELPWQIAGNYLFHFAAWQVFFFTGIALGHHRQRLARLFSPRLQYALFAASAVGFAALVALYIAGDSVWQYLPIPDPDLADPNSLLATLFGKGDVRPGRVVASVIVFGFLFLLVTLAWRPLKRALGWLLLPLGQDALFAYTAHIALVVVAGLILLPLGVGYRQQPWLNTALQIAGLLVVWALIQRRWLFPAPRARLRWALVPAGLAAVALLLLPASPTLTQAGAEPPATAASPRQRANVFGTPVPRLPGGGPPPAVMAGAPPLPEPRRAGGLGATGTNALPEYVGPIRGRFVEQSFFSRALNREMEYFVYLPAEYDTAGRAYPVLYMLHGASGAVEEWPAVGLIDQLDRAIEAREFEPFIAVLPFGYYSYWLNHAWDGPRWGDYVTKDLVAHVDSTYRTLRRPYRRAVGGLSMGATGALVQAFNHPQVFGIVGAHMPSLRDSSEDLSFLGVDEEFAERDPISLAAQAPGIEGLQLWLDVPADDAWLARVIELHDALLERGIPHEWHVWPGEHSLEYITQHIPDYLRWYGRALNRR